MHCSYCGAQIAENKEGIRRRAIRRAVLNQSSLGLSPRDGAVGTARGGRETMGGIASSTLATILKGES